MNTTDDPVVNETEPVSPGEKFNRTFGPLTPKENYTVVLMPKIDDIQGIPRKFNITTGMKYCYCCQRYFFLATQNSACFLNFCAFLHL